MRTVPSQLLTECQSPAPRIAQALYILRSDGEAMALTTADMAGEVADIPIGGSVEPSVTFAPLPEGVTFTNIERTVGTDVDNGEVVIHETAAFNLPDVLDGRWRGAPWVAGLYCWAHPEYGFLPLSCGEVGKVKQRVGRYIVELRDLRQRFNGNPTPVTQPGCLWSLFSNDEVNGFCTLDPTPFTVVEMPVSAVASQREFTCDVLAGDPSDRYGNGLLTWTSGVNVGRAPVRVVSFEAGVIVLDEDMVKGIEVDDEFTLTWGCRGRFDEDCVGKFSEVVPLQFYNFGGQPHAPGPDKSLNPPGRDSVAAPPPAP